MRTAAPLGIERAVDGIHDHAHLAALTDLELTALLRDRQERNAKPSISAKIASSAARSIT